MYQIGFDEEAALCYPQREMAVGASYGMIFAVVASEPGGRKLFSQVESPRESALRMELYAS